MSRYIDADKLTFSRVRIIHSDGTAGGWNAVVMSSVINNAPTADVVEVRHSRIKWVNRPISAQYATVTDEYGEKHYGKVHDFIENNPVGYCEECGKRLDDNFMHFCPNCGAKMDGERRE